MKQSDNMYKHISNIISKLSGEMTNARLEELVSERFNVCSKMVQKLTGTNVSDISIHYEESGEPLALYRCCVLQAPLGFTCKYAGEDEIVIIKSTIKKAWKTYCHFNERRFKMLIDSTLAHELFHAVDARTNSSIFTRTRLFDIGIGLTQSEMYTDWRAYRALSSTIYREIKGADKILLGHAKLNKEDLAAFNETIPTDQTYTASLTTVENAVERKFALFSVN